MPKRPPERPDPATDEYHSFIAGLINNPQIGPLTESGKYLHWNELRHREPPEGLTTEMWWWLTKYNRSLLARPLPLVGMSGVPLTYTAVQPLEQALHEFDRDLAGNIDLPDVGIGGRDRTKFIRQSLEEESIMSSLIEGAATTREEARELLRTERPPRSKGERMVLNNFRTMERIVESRQQPLTPGMVCELHRLVTEGTMENPDAAGRLRNARETWVVVEDMEGQILHQPPPADELPARLQQLCAFANDAPGDGEWVHPIVRAIALHFMIGHDHPFVDGNGRTARALFYWSMLRSGYWLCEYLSISEQIIKSYARYGRAYLHTETDQNDLTYFLLFHTRVLREAVDALQHHITRKAAEIQQADQSLSSSHNHLNGRQRHLLSHALRNPATAYTFTSHAGRERISSVTARKDLLGLEEAGLLIKSKRGRAFVFTVPSDLERRMKAS
jgi:Fic family protein